MANQLKTIFLLGVLSALLIGIGQVLSPGNTTLFVVMAAVMNLGAYFFSDRVVLRVSGAREVSVAEAPDLHAIVDELARAAGIPKPKVCIIDQQQPNAFATGRSPAHGVVAVTRGILDLLDRSELRAVLAHEIGHVVHRDILISSIAAVMATAIGYAAQSLMFAGLFGGRRSDDDDSSGAGGLLLMLVAPLAATLVQLGISRSREYLADDAGAELSGDPDKLAAALGKLQHYAERIPADVAPATASLYIVNPLSSVQARMAKLFSTHPPIEERIERLHEMARTPHARPSR
ncbi:MAG TPA: zinc metalloprotease HtpX [Candidatus Limnocylindrales bacterium]|nr:zinc metalloprotease HtpX [Candidatus Limnocylindrales bacterium]